MEEKSDLQKNPPTPIEEESRDLKFRRPYEQPRIEVHELSRAIRGNESPVTADGLSGSYRV